MSEFKIKLVIWSASESDCIFSMEKKKKHNRYQSIFLQQKEEL
jgi:hypothetical protein